MEFWYEANSIQSYNWKFRSRFPVEKNCTAVYMDMLLDTGLVALIGKYHSRTYYGMLRCCTLPIKENFPRERPAPWLLRQIFLLPVQSCTFLPTKGRHWNFLLSLWKFHHTSIVKASTSCFARIYLLHITVSIIRLLTKYPIQIPNLPPEGSDTLFKQHSTQEKISIVYCEDLCF